MKGINFIDGTSKSSSGYIAGSKSSAFYKKRLAQAKKSDRNRHHIFSISTVIAKTKAYLIIRGVKSALKEVDLIESGKKKPKSLDQLLNEL